MTERERDGEGKTERKNSTGRETHMFQDVGPGEMRLATYPCRGRNMGHLPSNAEEEAVDAGLTASELGTDDGEGAANKSRLEAC